MSQQKKQDVPCPCHTPRPRFTNIPYQGKKPPPLLSLVSGGVAGSVEAAVTVSQKATMLPFTFLIDGSLLK